MLTAGCARPMGQGGYETRGGLEHTVSRHEESGLLPSVGTIGTLVAIAFGVGLTRRQDD